jgi:hypothetical protein
MTFGTESSEGTVQVVSGGLQTMTNSAFYHLHSNFTPFSSINKTHTLQYTLKTTQTISCSGNGMKVFSSYPNSYFWFGPDTCGGSSQIFIAFMADGVQYQMTKLVDPG